MNLKRVSFSLGIITILITLSCGVLNEDTLITQPNNSPTPSEIYTPTIVPSFTLIPTKIPSPTPTPSRTLKLTPTIISTLIVKEAQNKLHELFASNEVCRLPCIWGITPGKSTFTEVQNILIPFGGFTYYSPGIGNIKIYNEENDLEYIFWLDFLSDANNVVTFISFEARAEEDLISQDDSGRVFDSKSFWDFICPLTLPKILSTYGRPDSIMLSTLAEPMPPNRGFVYFRILLLYLNQGILVNYTTEIQVVGNQISGCPSNAHIDMELIPSGHSDNFYELITHTRQVDIRNNYQPLEEVTDMSIEDFYQTFREPTDQCVMTPSKYWPEPEK